MSRFVCMALATVVVSLMVIQVTSYPNRVPSSACTVMFPTGHTADAQKSSSPFRLSVSDSSYSVGTAITVTLETTADTYDDKPVFIKGLFVQARKAVGCGVENDVPQGEFSALNSLLKSMSCRNNSDAIHHSSGVGKTKAQFTWRATESVGHIYFRATVVWKKKTFWTNVFSPMIIELNQAQSMTPEICDPDMTIFSQGSVSRNQPIAPMMAGLLAILFYLSR